jgi:hypothetical protein
MPTTTRTKYDLLITATVNGQVGMADFRFQTGQGETAHEDKGDVFSAADRERVVKKAAAKLKIPEARLRKQVDAACQRFVENLKQAVTQAAAAAPPANQKVSAATILVQLVEAAHPELFHSPDDVAYARIRVGDHHEVWGVRTSKFRLWLKKLYYEQTKKAPSSQSVEAALGVLESKARFDGAEHAVHVRVAEHQGRTFLDLGRPDWRVVEVTSSGWRVVVDPTVRFRRANGTLPLPVPVRGGDLTLLRGFLNLAGEDPWTLTMAWLTAAMRGLGPFPLLVLTGEPGTCKTTAGRFLQWSLDPNAGGLRSGPKEPRDLMIAARNAWLVAYDNLSHIPQWLSDCLCRLATGGGFGTRQLYTDDEEILFNAKRPALLTSIEDVVTAGDALDRAVSLQLEPVPDAGRRAEEDLDVAFAAALPRILGALLDAVAWGLRELPDVRLDKLPRMADFAKWGEAVIRGLGRPPGTFLAAYEKNRQGINEVALEASPVVGPLRVFLLQQKDRRWEGTASELLEALTRQVGESVSRQQGWPKKPAVISNTLRRLAPNLRRAGTVVEWFKDTARGRSRLIRLTQADPDEKKGGTGRPSRPSRPTPGPAPGGTSDGSDGSDDPSRPHSYGGSEREPGEEG